MKQPREWKPALCHRAGHSNTGLTGISACKIRGRDCFRVSLRPARGIRKITTIYFGRRGVTREAALGRAKALRFATIARRVIAEERIAP